MHDTGCLGLVHWDDPEGWNGEGGGRRVQDGEHAWRIPGMGEPGGLPSMGSHRVGHEGVKRGKGPDPRILHSET